jgi:hypothetical protein
MVQARLLYHNIFGYASKLSASSLFILVDR